MSIEWIFTIIAVVIVGFYILVRIFMDEPAEGHYSIPDLPNEDREAAWDKASSDRSIDDLGDQPIDDLGDQPIDDLSEEEDDDMNIDDLPDLS